MVGPLEPGTYSVDPDGDPSTPIRVHLTLTSHGWAPPTGSWRGIAKDFGSERRELIITIAIVANVAHDGCSGAAPADPPIGPDVDDLVGALTALAPFEVTSPPSDVTTDGYDGTHLELTVHDLSECSDGAAYSWMEVGVDDPFSGYAIEGTTEELWILDVDGTRVMISAVRRPDATSEDRGEMQAILESIRIET